MVFDLRKILRANVRGFKPYSCARTEFAGEASVLLDANENSLGSSLPGEYNRYPDPLQRRLKERLSEVKDAPVSRIFVGNGSDEVIDLLIRAVCEPGRDKVLVFPPTYGMYEVCAALNDAEVEQVPLTQDFSIDIPALAGNLDERIKIAFVCSPNNPTGNCIDAKAIETLLERTRGIVVLDEAYTDFCPDRSFIRRISDFPNLVVMQTLSKAWGLAGLRLGMAFASEDLTDVLSRIKPPYNVGSAAQALAIEALTNGAARKEEMVRTILEERARLARALAELRFVRKVFPSDANFLLVKMDDPRLVYRRLIEKHIVVRDRSSAHGCADCVRITVGAPEQNRMLLAAMKDIEG